MVDAVDGCLICAIGQKIFIHAFIENDLRATGFVDTQEWFIKQLISDLCISKCYEKKISNQEYEKYSKMSQ